MHSKLIDTNTITIPAIKQWHELRRRGYLGKHVDEVIAEYERIEKRIAKQRPINQNQAFQLLSIAAILWHEDLANRKDVDCKFTKHRYDTIHQMVGSVLRFLGEDI